MCTHLAIENWEVIQKSPCAGYTYLNQCSIYFVIGMFNLANTVFTFFSTVFTFCQHSLYFRQYCVYVFCAIFNFNAEINPSSSVLIFPLTVLWFPLSALCLISLILCFYLHLCNTHVLHLPTTADGKVRHPDLMLGPLFNFCDWKFIMAVKNCPLPSNQDALWKKPFF